MNRLFVRKRGYDVKDLLKNKEDSVKLLRVGPLTGNRVPTLQPEDSAPHGGRLRAKVKKFGAFLARFCPFRQTTFEETDSKNDILSNKDTKPIPLAISTEDKKLTITSVTSQGEKTSLDKSNEDIKTVTSGAVEAPLASSIQDNKPLVASVTSEGQISAKTSVNSKAGNDLTVYVPFEDHSYKPTMEQFTFHRVLGEGTFGKVVLASHAAIDQKLAVKMVRKTALLQNNPSPALTESYILERCSNSPFVTHLHCSFQTETHVIFAMEFLGGGTLERLIKNSAPFDEATIRRLSAEILCGLQYLHSHQIIHRDLKPENILLDNDRHAKIADFGLSTILGTEFDRVTDSVGTFLYMAPEVYMGMQYYYPADYFSFGIIVYEMAVGSHPFYTGQEDRHLLAITMYTTKAQFPEDIEYPLCELIHGLLTHDQEERVLLVRNLGSHCFFEGIDWAEIEKRPSRVPRASEPILEPLEEVIPVDAFLSEDRRMPIDPEDQLFFVGFTYISGRMKAITG